MTTTLSCPIDDCSRITPGRGFGGPLPAHTGVDYPVPHGTPVRAPGAGIVRDVFWNAGGGRMVAITHTDRVESRFAHLSASLVRKGQTVAAGQVVALSGATGASVRGAHLHAEVLVDGRVVDPAPYFGGRASASGGAPDVAFGEITPEAPAGTYPDVNGSGGGRCDVAGGWRDTSAIETFVRPEVTGYCVKVSPVDVAGGIAGAALGELVPIAANVALLAAAALIGWGGVRRILDA